MAVKEREKGSGRCTRGEIVHCVGEVPGGMELLCGRLVDTLAQPEETV